MNVGMVGLGNIGHSLLSGFSLKNKEINIFAFDHNNFAHTRAKNYVKNIQLTSSVEDVFLNAEVVFICIRTNQVEPFITEYGKYFIGKKIIVFLSAGISDVSFIQWMNKYDAYLFKAITNINTSSGNGYTVILKNKNKQATKTVIKLFKKVGRIQLVESNEKLITVSLVSGCTPAIFTLFYESLVNSGINIGLSRKQSEKLVINTIQSTLSTLDNNILNARELIQKACTPGGVVLGQLHNLEYETDFKEDVTSWLPKIFEELKTK